MRRPPAKDSEAPAVLFSTDPLAAAEAADLVYVSDLSPGIRRKRTGNGFRYEDPEGHPLGDTLVLNRIKHLAIPPAWSDVWISPLSNGHIQASGRDARGRKQYRYHARWREVRDKTFPRVVGKDFKAVYGPLIERLELWTYRAVAAARRQIGSATFERSVSMLTWSKP